jgi:molybdate transport system substrate-binding protein
MHSLAITALLTMVAGALWAGPATAQQTGLHVLSPGVAYNAGLVDLAKSYSEKTGIQVTVKAMGMTKIVDEVQKGTPITDVVVLPVSIMDGMAAEDAIVRGSRAELGRVYIGLAVRKGEPHPDISTPAKLAAALKAGGTVMVSNPAHGSMSAGIINNMLHQYPIFHGVKSRIAIHSEGGEALVKGEGGMALQLVSEILNHPEISLVGIVPEELHAYIDTSLAIPRRSTHSADAKAFIAYLLAPEHVALWKSKGLERVK